MTTPTIHLNFLVSGYEYALKVSTQNTRNKNSPSSETRRISLKSNSGNNLSTDGSSMVNNVDAQESPINNLPQKEPNLPQKEPNSSSVLKEPSTTSNCLPKYQNMNGSALQRVETISMWNNSKKNCSIQENFSQKSPPKNKSTPENFYYNNSPKKSPQKTPKTSNNSNPEKKSYHDISYQDGQLKLNQADINAIKNKWITNVTVSNNSSQNNLPIPAKAPPANISKFQLFRSSHWDSFLENPTPVHEGKQLSIKCYVCKSTFADNPHLKMRVTNINSYNFKSSDFECNICWASKTRNFGN